MASWRDSASPEAQSDMDELLNAALPFAQQQLAKHGEFYPYGVALTIEGKVELLAASTGDEHPASTELLGLLAEGARSKLSQLRAAAFIADIRMGPGQGDAIRVDIEHREGHAIAVLLPYSKKSFGRGLAYGQLIGAPSTHRLWSGRGGR
jgi:hypothetical protein